jgi:hypothetical protein
VKERIVDPVSQEINRQVGQQLGLAMMDAIAVRVRNVALQQQVEALQQELATLKAPKEPSDVAA